VIAITAIIEWWYILLALETAKTLVGSLSSKTAHVFNLADLRLIESSSN
jgi:hypothetical protein